MSDEDIQAEVAKAISNSGIDHLLTKDEFFHAFEHQQRAQRSLSHQNQIIIAKLQHILDEVGQDKHLRYSTMATSSTPSLVLFLIDVGYHMRKKIGQVEATELIQNALRSALGRMVMRSTKGKSIVSRYHLGCYTYGQTITDMYGAIRPIDHIARVGIPQIRALDEIGDTYEAFRFLESVLQQNINKYEGCPAPLICHITGGEYPGRDPELITERIMSLKVGDGNILISNVLMDDEAVLLQMHNPKFWPGIRDATDLAKEFARKLCRMSSVIPEKYRNEAISDGYYLATGSRMLYPGTQPDIINLGFVFAAATMLVRS